MSGPLKTMESHFSLVWVVAVIIISTCFGKGSIHSCQPSRIARETHAFLTYRTPASRLVFFLTRNSRLTFHK